MRWIDWILDSVSTLRFWIQYKLAPKSSLYVWADGRDSSITISYGLAQHMRLMEQEQAKVFVFRMDDDNGHFAFILNPKELQGVDTVWCQVQFNNRHHCIGFETLCPTVQRIFCDYGIPSEHCFQTIRMSVIPHDMPYGDEVYYEIVPPEI